MASNTSIARSSAVLAARLSSSTPRPASASLGRPGLARRRLDDRQNLSQLEDLTTPMESPGHIYTCPQRGSVRESAGMQVYWPHNQRELYTLLTGES